MRYNSRMFQVLQTPEYIRWFKELRDPQGRARVLLRVKRLELGNLGDVKSLGEGVMELRIHTGPGYRVYFLRRGTVTIMLLGGGDKGSQTADIAAAKALAKELKG